jgi:hypothetical protein
MRCLAALAFSLFVLCAILAFRPLSGAGSPVGGLEHQPREKDGAWKFTRWDLVDLAQFKVRLKAEFQGSNRDMYRSEAIVATSAK